MRAKIKKLELISVLFFIRLKLEWGRGNYTLKIYLEKKAKIFISVNYVYVLVNVFVMMWGKSYIWKEGHLFKGI